MSTLGERLKAKLKENGINQTQLAEMVGVHPSTVSWWVNGKSSLTEENLNTVCDLLGCDADWLKGNTRQFGRNASGAMDPTMYAALKNIESEEKTVEHYRGTMWEIETEFGRNRKAVIVSCDERAGDRYLNSIFLTEEERGKIVVPVECGETMYADCTKVSLVTEERVGGYLGKATEQEMADIDAGIIEALGLPGETTVFVDDADVWKKKSAELEDYIRKLKQKLEDATVPTSVQVVAAEANEEMIRVQIERDMYKEQFEKLLNKMIG